MPRLTFEDCCFIGRIDFLQPPPGLWRGGGWWGLEFCARRYGIFDLGFGVQGSGIIGEGRRGASKIPPPRPWRFAPCTPAHELCERVSVFKFRVSGMGGGVCA